MQWRYTCQHHSSFLPVFIFEYNAKFQLEIYKNKDTVFFSLTKFMAIWIPYT